MIKHPLQNSWGIIVLTIYVFFLLFLPGIAWGDVSADTLFRMGYSQADLTLMMKVEIIAVIAIIVSCILALSATILFIFLFKNEKEIRNSRQFDDAQNDEEV